MLHGTNQSPDEKVAAWNPEGTEVLLMMGLISDDVEDDIHKLGSNYAAAFKILVMSQHFKQLADKIRKALLLTPRDGSVAEQINRQIVASLTKSPAKRDSNELSNARFHILWDPVAFLREQNREDGPYEDLGKVIVIVGTVTDAQATTCREYMRQTWPLTGLELLNLLQDLLYHDYGAIVNCEQIIPPSYERTTKN